jgi:Flp pilus assembly CpaE family ATPase
MSRNGHHPTSLRVLLSGPAADRIAAALELDPAIDLVRPGTADAGLARSSDVAIHVLETSSAPNVAEQVERVRTLSDAPLILAAYGEPNGIVETGLEVGAADVLVLPQPDETLLFAIRKAAVAVHRTGHGKVVTVFSPKGGSGKTVLATNLAVAVARSGARTLLIDLDLQFGDSALTLAVEPRATIANLATSAGAVDAEKLKAFVSTDPRTGLDVLPAPKRPEEADAVGQAELVAVLVAARSMYEAVVVDTGPLFDRGMLAALDHTDQLLLVCNPELTSLKNVRIGLETIDRLGFEREKVSLVANRLGAPGGVGRSEIETALDAEVAYELPNDSAVVVAVNRALPVVVSDEGSSFARAVTRLAAEVFAPGQPSGEASRRQRRFQLRGRR